MCARTNRSGLKLCTWESFGGDCGPYYKWQPDTGTGDDAEEQYWEDGVAFERMLLCEIIESKKDCGADTK